MFKTGQILLNNADFDNAMFFGIDVMIWQEKEIVDYGGKITKHTVNCVFIQEDYYLKQNCIFIVR